MGYEYYQVRPGDWERLNLALREIFRNLDIRAGNAGVTPQFNSINMQGHHILGGPANQVGIPATEFITKGYLATNEFATVVESLASTVEVASTIAEEDSAATTLTDILELVHTSTRTPAAGFGGSILFSLENTGKVRSEAGRLNMLWSDATIGSEDAVFTVRLKTAGAALAEKFRITSTGLVGIGTASPQSALSFPSASHIGVATIDGSDNGYLTIGGGGVFGATRGGSIVLYGNEYGAGAYGKITLRAGTAYSSGQDGSIDLQTQSLSRLSVMYDGKIGIGTTGPGTLLHIKAASATNDGLRIETDNNKIGQIQFYDGGVAGQVQYNHATDSMLLVVNGSDAIFIDSSQNVGIGSGTPGAKLSVNGGVHVGGDANPGDNNLRVDGKIEVNTSSGSGALTVIGGVHIGGTSDAGSSNLALEGTITCQGNQVITARQAAEADAGAVSSLTLNSGADQVDRAAFNTALSTMVSEVNGIKSTLNNLLAKLRTHGLIAT